jgi:periplasmic mercuric ion binding protein
LLGSYGSEVKFGNDRHVIEIGPDGLKLLSPRSRPSVYRLFVLGGRPIGLVIDTFFWRRKMRWLAWCLMLVCACTVGCNQPQETIPAVTPGTSGTTDDGHDHVDGDDHGHTEASHTSGSGEAVRFVADKRINVPSMMCPYSCWPKVKETLASQPGVEAVQLAEQPAGAGEGEIVDRVVELKLNGNFDADAAIAALAKVSFEAELAN